MAIHITMNSIKKAWQDFNGSHVIFCLEGRSFRKDMYAPYKRNRKDLLFTLENLLDPKRLLKFVEDNSKKTSIKFDKREVVGFVQLVINQHYKTDKIGIEFKKLVKG